MSELRPFESITPTRVDDWIQSLHQQVKRIETSQPRWAAFTHWMTPSEVDALATQAEHCLRAPLQGAAVAVKDILNTTHLPSEYGSVIYRDHRPASPSAVVHAIERAGGVVLGKTVTTEFAFLEPPMTRNPRAPSRSPGGSSSGSVAAVAAGLVRFAVGTQTGGSIIRPASYCGVVGYKPTFGLINTAGLKAFSSSLDTVGLFAANVPDCIVFARAIIPWSVRERHPRPEPSMGSRQAQRDYNFAMLSHYPWGDPSPEYQRVMQQVLAQVRDAGLSVTEVTLPPMVSEAFDAHAIVQGYESFRALGHELQHHAARLSPLLKNYLLEQSHLEAYDYQAALATIERARAWADDFFEEFDGLLSASAPDVAPEPSSTGSSSFNRVWTALGTPAITLPIARVAQPLDGTVAPSSPGLPLGLQVIAGRFQDPLMLDCALLLESLSLHG
jgi:Asp-tRNA(Asn)/Glu-tRNA(Gln) amidotransferase A subunit family amidase